MNESSSLLDIATTVTGALCGIVGALLVTEDIWLMGFGIAAFGVVLLLIQYREIA